MGKISRLIFGRRLKTIEAPEQHVGPLQGVPILGLDALGSASYGPEAALAILIPVGAAGLFYVREVIGAILLLLAILFFSYRQTIAAYPSGGGSFTVAKENLGKAAGLVAASSLLMDYVLNVAVGISAGVGALESAIPALQQHTLAACLVVLVLITIVNLRGVRDSGLAWAIPTYTFVLGLVSVIAIGIWRTVQSSGHPVPVVAPPPISLQVVPISAWLLMRAFASGCTAMTGVEAVSNGIPIFAQPSVKNARRTLALICSILGVLLAGIGYLVHAYQIGALDQEKPGYQSVISQLTSAVVGRGPLYYLVIAGVLGVLTLSANTSFAGFPRLCCFLAQDSYLPNTFANLGRRLVYSIGITVLTVLSGILLIVFGGVTDRLIPLFAVGAFGAFTMSQAGMVMHWRRLGKGFTSPSLIINAAGAFTTGVALVIIIMAKFTEGAWISVLMIAFLIWLFWSIRRHYAQVKRETRPPIELQTWKLRPIKVVIPIEGWDRITERGLRCALRISQDITAVHVTAQPSADELVELWRTRIQEPARAAGLPEPRIEIIRSPYRMLYEPILDYIKSVQQKNPDCLIAVVIPELVQPRWWEYFLHNHGAGMLKAMLLLEGEEHLVIISTPWYLREE